MKNLTLVMTRVFRTKVDMTNNAPMFIRVLLWLMLLPVYDPASADEPSARESSVRAAELLFDAAKAASEENGDISTIVADFELTINHPSVSPEDEEKEIQSRIERQEQDIQATSDEGLKRYLKESIKFIPDGVRQRNSRPQRMRGKYTLRLRPRPEMRKIKLAHFRNATEQWSEGVLGLSKVETGGIKTGINYEIDSKSATISNSLSGMDRIALNGRLQDTAVILLLLHKYLSADGSYNLKDAYAAFVNEGVEFSLGGTANYGDGHHGVVAILTIPDVGSGKSISYHVTVDAERGFICPVIKKYGFNGSLLQEWVSENYFHDRASGLWFPQKLTYTMYDPIKPSSVKEIRVLEVVPDTTQLNSELADDMFSVTLPPGVTIFDNRGSSPIAYNVLSDAVIDFSLSSLQLSERPEFSKTANGRFELPKSGPLQKNRGHFKLLLIANLILLGVVLIGYALRRALR